MAISKTEIANKSLTLVGANPIVNISDENENARVLNRVYELSLRSILSECKWNFATKRALLTVSAETMPWNDVGEVFVYVKPADVIRIFGTSYRPAKWRVEGDLIVSDTQALGIRYVYYLDDPSKYSASFLEAFIDKLASDIAYMIVNSASLGETFIAKYRKISLPTATAENAQSGTQQTPFDGAWELAKYANAQADA